MRDYESYKDEWKNEVGKAVARFIMNVTAMAAHCSGARARTLRPYFILRAIRVLLQEYRA